jgi:triosephosphate isomerase
MNKTVRKTVIAGNWKMNYTPAQAKKFISELLPNIKDYDGCDVVLCVPFVDIATAVEAVAGTNIKIGAQNVHYKETGAYTGEISAPMLKEIGVEYAILGHSERRKYFGEVDRQINRRLKAAVKAGLTVILCVGELELERDEGITAEIVAIQTKVALLGIDAEQMKNVIIAYEPVWAIGTGRTATADQAEETCACIREVLADKYGCDLAESVTIQYGGSMNAANADELLSKVNVDGGLIGGASLKVPDFTEIVKAAQK